MDTTTIFDLIAKEWKPWFRRHKWLPGKEQQTWGAWFAFLRILFDLPLEQGDGDLFRQCTGRSDVPAGGFTNTYLICGRRSGKSRMLAMIAVFVAVFRDWSPYLSPGERGTVMILSADRKQSRAIFNYAAAFLKALDVETVTIERETMDTVELGNGISIEIGTANFRTIRGYTVVAGLLDEAAFWNDGGANPDQEILTALKPSMATVPGSMLLVASSPYSKRGILFEAYRKHHGKDGDPVLCWQAPTRTMNPSVSEAFIKAEYEKDAESARAEFGAEFRDDISTFVDRGLVESLIVPGRLELAPVPGLTYHAFVDPAGGSGGDSMTMAIAHKESNGLVVLDCIREVRPPFSPQEVVNEFSAVFDAYNVKRIIGDHWGGLFVREPFQPLQYVLSKRTKSVIYRDSLALLNSRTVQLLDHSVFKSQLCSLERRTGRGADIIDHPPNQRDDVCNAAMGAILAANNQDHERVSWSWTSVSMGPSVKNYLSGAMTSFLRDGTSQPQEDEQPHQPYMAPETDREAPTPADPDYYQMVGIRNGERRNGQPLSWKEIRERIAKEKEVMRRWG